MDAGTVFWSAMAVFWSVQAFRTFRRIRARKEAT